MALALYGLVATFQPDPPGAYTRLMDAAALGLTDRLADAPTADHLPTGADLTAAFWQACHGGQLDLAQTLLERGADLKWVGWGALEPFSEQGSAHCP